MGRSKVSKFEDVDVEANVSKLKRVETPPARVFQDLPTAYSEIVGQARTPTREMQNMTGDPLALPPLIDLPGTPARPVPTSPEVLQKFANASAQRFGTSPLSPPERVLIRNSRSFFDLDQEYKRQENQPSRAGNAPTPCTVDMHPGAAARPRDNNVLVRNSVDIIGIAISGDENYSLSGKGRGEFSMPVTSGLSRNRLPASTPPRAALPDIPSGVRRIEYQRDDLPGSEVAEYDNTQSLLRTGRPDPHTETPERIPPQTVSNERVGDDVPSQDDGGNVAIVTSADAPSHHSAAAAAGFGHEVSRYGTRQPTALSPGIGYSSDASGNVVCDETELGTPGPAIRTSSGLCADQRLSELASGEQEGKCEVVKEMSGPVDIYQRKYGSAEWFANATKKDFKMKQKGKGVEEMEDDRDWETVQGSAFGSEQQLSQAALQLLQPHSEPHLCLRDNNLDLRSDPSLADFSSSSFESVPTSQNQPATPWDPLQKGANRTHPALPDNPHMYRLRTNTSTGEEIYISEYSLPEINSGNIDAESTQAAPNLPAHHSFPVSRFSASTARQPAQKETSSDQDCLSSLPIFSQGRNKIRMVAAHEELKRAQGQVVHELEGDQVHGVGIAVSTDEAPGEYDAPIVALL